MRKFSVGLLAATAAIALSAGAAYADAGYSIYGGFWGVYGAMTNGDPNYFVNGEPGQTSGCSILNGNCAMSGIWSGYGTSPSPFGSSSQDGISSSGANCIANEMGDLTCAAFDHSGPGGAEQLSSFYMLPNGITFTSSNIAFLSPGGGFSNVTVGALTVTSGATITGGATIDILHVTGAETVDGLLTANHGLVVNGGQIVNGGSVINGGQTVNGGLTGNGGAVLWSGNGVGNHLLVDGTGAALLDPTGNNGVKVYTDGHDCAFGNGAIWCLNGPAAFFSNSNGRGMNISATTTTLTGGGSGGNTSTVTLNATTASIQTQNGNGLVATNAGAVTVLGAADNSGLTIGANGTDVKVVNADGYSGVTTTASATTMSGGATAATSTDLTLDQNGATFGNHTSGAPVQVHGVADGSHPYDAINLRQLRGAIAMGAAFAGLPQVDTEKRFGVGGGVGYFNGQTAGALGASFRPDKDVVVKVGVAFGSAGTAVNGGLGLSW